ncbi:hypothetical protein J2848_005659 [Azospirillum lipoferum]|uniref:ProQ/FinO domain-containing protein n=1 Tax=Azospirillum lipoferum TaxID=193 RepID=A0A5A9GGX3_AZOLI|nr:MULTISPECIES: ProQ/FinO family protein [Azospirillum]KAA0592982.1 hypothetical protein FZ942_26010 [Azospirillum lipoferum]MCP1613958.1 hypothetical protein [Azospirillum lipoferum]MDW5537648.1 ProQ/FinO family protein [Azospirillum sp. NL1]
MKMLTAPPLADEAPATSTTDPIQPAVVTTIDDQLTAAWSRLSIDQKRKALPILQRMVDHQNRKPGIAERFPKPAPGNRTGLRADRRALAAAFPACFNQPKSKAPKRPLKIGITADLIAHGVTGEDGQPLSHKRIERVVRDYCLGTKYDAALIPGSTRIDLDGNPAGSVSASHAAGRERKEGTEA